MTTTDKNQIIKLREEGLSFGEIAKRLGMSRSSVSTIYRRAQEQHVDRCKCCGLVIKQTAGHRQRLFCSDKCRIRWWRQNSTNHAINNKAVCLMCNKEFVYHESRIRKYCSLACAYKGRKKEASDNEK